MAAKLLIRVYNVGLGDCILCRIPGVGSAGSDFNMLIDCGSWSGIDLLRAALDDLATMLPDAGDGQKRLDLLVVTHEHKDHIAGCDPALFARFRIGAIWMNAAMDPDHPQAAGTRKLTAIAVQAMRGVTAAGLPLSPALADLAELLSIDNAGAMQALRIGLPAASSIVPYYVHAGQTNDELGLPLLGATIRVLGPEADIDGFYLGRRGSTVGALTAAPDPSPVDAGPAPPDVVGVQPDNIGAGDFRQLRARMLSNAFAFAALSSKVTNNSSVVLLVEWQGRRLLFVGDAEWDAAYTDGKANGSWNVMWSQRKEALSAPVDFLKIGHHGSENATPWNQTGTLSEPPAILDSILPLPLPNGTPSAVAVVSTERSKYPTIPSGSLLLEIGRRIRNATDYAARFQAAAHATGSLPGRWELEQKFLGGPQPQRTDFECALTGAAFVDVELESASGFTSAAGLKSN